MIQNKRFRELMRRNEEWILQNIKEYELDIAETDHSNLNNYPWEQTISSFNRFLSESTFDNSSTTLIYSSDKINLEFFEFIHNEVNTCLKDNIQSHTYLVYLKYIRKLFKELISSEPFEIKEKNAFTFCIDSFFDSLDIAILHTFNSTISDLHFAELMELKHQEETYKNILENFPHPAIILDGSKKIIGHNKKARYDFPYLFDTPLDALDRHSNTIGMGNLILGIEELKLSNQQEIHFESKIQTAEKEVWYYIYLRRIKETRQILISCINLERWKTIESQLELEKRSAEESNRLKTTFLANMSHEIRTPMNAIVGFAELITTSNPNKKEKIEYLNLIRKSSNDLMSIIEDVIDIAKIESKQLKIIPKNTNLAEIFNDLICIYNEVLIKHDKADIKLFFSAPPEEMDLTICTDPKRLKQVLSNLLGNAIKFTTSGQIETGFKLAENKLVYFFVKDTGIGIPMNKQKSIFKRFEQVEDDYSQNETGTGLGLSISKNIIHLLGGKIWVSSKPKKGSNFYFYLPYIPSLKQEDQNQSKKIPINSINLKNHKVLIAEDEEANFSLLKELLKFTGAKIIRAKNGREAITYAENHKLDLILMDIRMPEVNGIEAAKQICQICPTLPIIAITAFAMEEDKINCIKAGCRDYLSKPIQKDVLLRILYTYLIEKNSDTSNQNIKKERV